MPNPTNIIAQVADSGTAAAEIVSVLEPETMLVSWNVPRLNTGRMLDTVKRSGPANWVKPRLGVWMFNVAARKVPKPTNAVPGVPPKMPVMVLYDT